MSLSYKALSHLYFVHYIFYMYSNRCIPDIYYTCIKQSIVFWCAAMSTLTQLMMTDDLWLKNLGFEIMSTFINLLLMQMNKTFESNISSCGGHTLYSWPDALHTSKNTSWESTIAVGPTIGFSKILLFLSGPIRSNFILILNK